MAKSSDSKSKGYTNSDIAVMAVFRLGGSVRHIHLEDVAIKAAELSPKRFCWKKYPEQINLESVRLALKDELGASNNRVMGGIRDGWMLTPSGLTWCLETGVGGGDDTPISQLRHEVDRAKITQAFRKVTSHKPNVPIGEVEDLLRVDSYFTARNRRERIAALANAAVLDRELAGVLTTLREMGLIELEVKR